VRQITDLLRIQMPQLARRAIDCCFGCGKSGEPTASSWAIQKTASTSRLVSRTASALQTSQTESGELLASIQGRAAQLSHLATLASSAPTSPTRREVDRTAAEVSSISSLCLGG